MANLVHGTLGYAMALQAIWLHIGILNVKSKKNKIKLN